MVLAALAGDDIVLCQVTSRAISDQYSVSPDTFDFTSGTLCKPSAIRPNRLFTADSTIVLYKVGRIRDEKLRQVLGSVVAILTQ